MIYERIILLLFLFVLQNGMQPYNILIDITNSFTMHACTHDIAGVNGFTIYDTRLGSSSTSPTTSGRVEVLTQRGSWMPVCASSWGSSESRVICRQLGYVYSSYSENNITLYIPLLCCCYVLY